MKEQIGTLTLELLEDMSSIRHASFLALCDCYVFLLPHGTWCENAFCFTEPVSRDIMT